MSYFTKINCSTIFFLLHDAKVTPQVPVLSEFLKLKLLNLAFFSEACFPCSLSVNIVITWLSVDNLKCFVK